MVCVCEFMCGMHILEDFVGKILWVGVGEQSILVEKWKTLPLVAHFK